MKVELTIEQIKLIQRTIENHMYLMHGMTKVCRDNYHTLETVIDRIRDFEDILKKLGTGKEDD